MAEENVITAPEPEASPAHKRKLQDLELNAAPQPPTEENGAADESEPKQPRLETNNVDSANEQVSEKGHQEEERKENGSADDSGQPLEEQESVKDDVEETTEEPAPNDHNGKTEIASADELGLPNAGIDDLPNEGDVPLQSDGIQSGSDTQLLSRKMDVPNDKTISYEYSQQGNHASGSVALQWGPLGAQFSGDHYAPCSAPYRRLDPEGPWIPSSPRYQFYPQGNQGTDYYTVTNEGPCLHCSKQHLRCCVCRKFHHYLDCPYLNLLPEGASFNSSEYAVFCSSCGLDSFNQDNWTCDFCSRHLAVLRFKFCTTCKARTHFFTDCPVA